MESIGDPSSEDDVHNRPLGFYFLKPEIIPHNAYGTHRFDASGVRMGEFEVRPQQGGSTKAQLIALGRTRLSIYVLYWKRSAYRIAPE